MTTAGAWSDSQMNSQTTLQNLAFTGGAMYIPVKVTLDISRSPIEIQWGYWKYPG